MPKTSDNGITAQIKKTAGGGKQSVAPGGDYGAKAMFRAADSPSCVKDMVKPNFAKYKHDRS